MPKSTKNTVTVDVVITLPRNDGEIVASVNLDPAEFSTKPSVADVNAAALGAITAKLQVKTLDGRGAVATIKEAKLKAMAGGDE